MKKKIAILAALAGEPEILVLNEPYTLLDRNSISTLNQILIEKPRTAETIVIASHVFTGIEEKADSVTVLVNGDLAFHTTLNKPAIMDNTIIYECEAEDPIKLAKELYTSGIKEIQINKNKISFKTRQPTILPISTNCMPKIDIRKVYENLVAKPGKERS